VGVLKSNAFVVTGQMLTFDFVANWLTAHIGRKKRGISTIGGNLFSNKVQGLQKTQRRKYSSRLGDNLTAEMVNLREPSKQNLNGPFSWKLNEVILLCFKVKEQIYNFTILQSQDISETTFLCHTDLITYYRTQWPH
jgi:hypothetical protein